MRYFMKNVLILAAATLGFATAGDAGSDPVVPGVPVVITTSITIPTVTSEVGVPVGGRIPVFFVVTPPVTPGGQFTFRLVSN